MGWLFIKEISLWWIYDRFKETDRSRIIPVLNKYHDNHWYGSKGGADTKDNIFLLSLEEVCTYFGDSHSRLLNPGKNQRYWFERKDENNSRRIAKLQGKEGSCWWSLISTGTVLTIEYSFRGNSQPQ